MVATRVDVPELRNKRFCAFASSPRPPKHKTQYAKPPPPSYRSPLSNILLQRHHRAHTRFYLPDNKPTVSRTRECKPTPTTFQKLFCEAISIPDTWPPQAAKGGIIPFALDKITLPLTLIDIASPPPPHCWTSRHVVVATLGNVYHTARRFPLR